MLKEIERQLAERSIPFSAEYNRIRFVYFAVCQSCCTLEDYIETDRYYPSRCFPHVVNIAVQTALKSLSKSSGSPPPDIDVTPVDGSRITDRRYAETLLSDPVAKCRTTVNACRDSHLRMEALEKTIIEGNLANEWPDALHLRVLQLLRDVDTRWSSTFLMIDRALYLSVVRSFNLSRCLLCVYSVD